MSDDEDLVDPFNPFPDPIRVPITDVFDLHTIQPREVKLVVEEYLNEAQRLGYQSVRIIHGKGIGAKVSWLLLLWLELKLSLRSEAVAYETEF